MKLFFRLLILYVLFLIQTAITRPQLDLVVLGLIIFSLHDTPIYALILGLWSGILLGLVNPVNFGFHIFAFTTIAYTCNYLRRYIYKYKIYFISILFISLSFRYVLTLIFIRAQQSFLMWLLATAVILTIALPLENFFVKIFYTAPIFRH